MFLHMICIEQCGKKIRSKSFVQYDMYQKFARKRSHMTHFNPLPRNPETKKKL